MTVEQGAECLSVVADDTDVYILLLHYYNQKELNIPMFMESSVHKRQTIDIRATAKSMLTFYQSFKQPMGYQAVIQ